MMFRVTLWRRLIASRATDRCLRARALQEYPRILQTPPINSYIKNLASRSYVTSTLIQESVEKNKSMPLDPSTEISNTVQAIETSVKNSNRVKKSTLCGFLDMIEVKGHPLDDQTWLLLLRCCGSLLPDEVPSARVKLADRVWKLLKHSGCPLTVDHYNALLYSHLENRNLISLPNFLELMGNVVPTETTYLLLLELMCEGGNIDAAAEVIQHMKRENLPANERMFNALLKCNAKLRDHEGCQKILETMRAAHILPSVDSFASLLEGFGEAGDINGFKTTYTDATASSVSFSEKHILNILRKTALSTNYQIFSKVLQIFPSGLLNMTPNVANLATHLVHLGKVQEAYTLFKYLPNDADYQNYSNFFIEDIVKTNQETSIIVSICEDLENTGRNSCALLTAAEVALSAKKVEIALGIFKAMKLHTLPLRPHYFWPLLVIEAREKGEKGVFNILSQMKELEVSPDSDTLQDYVLPYCSLSDPVQLVRKLQDLELKLSAIMVPLLAVLLRLGCLQHIQELCGTYKFQIDASSLTTPLAVAYLVTKDLPTVISLIKTFSSISNNSNTDVGGYFLLGAMTSKRIKIEAKEIVNIMQAFKEESIFISSAAADAIYYQLQRHTRDLHDLKINRNIIYQLVKSDTDPSKESNNHMLHPREMTLEELECHLLELKSKSMNTRGVLRRLLQMYCKLGDCQNAARIEKEFERAGHEFSPGMYAALLDVHVKCKNLEAAQKYFTHLMQEFPGLKLDEYKVVDYATLLISCGKETDALHVLKNYASSHKIRNTTEISRNCFKLLNAVAEKNNPDITKRMLEQLARLGYCSVTNVLLGAVIRTYLNCNNLEGAVTEYVNCVKEFRKTPLQHELMCQLAKSEQHEPLLELVLDGTKEVHGSDAAWVSYAAAVAETGSTTRLRSILLNKHFNWSLFIQRCKRFVDEKKLSPLEKIVAAGQGLPHPHIPSIYTYMLEIYCRQGDTVGALSLWTSAQEANIIPEPKFLIKLASLLKSHKCEVPFTVPTAEENIHER
ncbi:leucine-rich PPR motif-containing protein, mitochondrial-like isoform X1 [Schistocerca americana]|uniref:leucine-rich PPR motif-containing protein, mitochondrial-like isoform X1 n=2 Tax=Schistocerca americana TaxID=7009 RepID=UPI001F4FFBA9|nr:leucine-rich PPR motif-containing protein, mitochondrial-like isoform X1 [Schistocerca americana]